ncbi:MAG: hypothetical protein HOK83_16010, partial [Rhodospirillaceae bacterium]|nr:hypothetical protein [Rhodospirillaceae bacterium]
MSTTLLLAVTSGLLLITIAIGGGSFVYMRASTARYRKRLDQFSGRADKTAARKSGGGRDQADKTAARKSGGGRDQAGNRRRQIQGKLKELEEEQQSKKEKAGLRELLIEADMKITPKKFYLIGLAMGVGATLVYMVLDYPIWGAPMAFIAVGFGLPRWWVKKKGLKRRVLFTKNFANAVDVIVRGVQSGLPVN